MERQPKSLLRFLKSALKRTWVYFYTTVWSIFGSLTRLRDNFLSDASKEEYGTRRLLSKIPAMGWRMWAIGILMAIVVAIVMEALLEIRGIEKAYFDAQDEIDRLKSAPLSIELTVHEIIQHVSFEASQLNRDVFFRISANLLTPSSADVEYQLSLILRGKTIWAVWLGDVDQWCRTEIVRTPDPFLSRQDKPFFEMDGLPAHLKIGQKVDAWLHFKIEGLADGMLSKCALRLIAKSPQGATSCDLPEGSYPIIPHGWRIVRKVAVQG